jgi:hypothetical protein
MSSSHKSRPSTGSSNAAHRPTGGTAKTASTAAGSHKKHHAADKRAPVAHTVDRDYMATLQTQIEKEKKGHAAPTASGQASAFKKRQIRTAGPCTAKHGATTVHDERDS